MSGTAERSGAAFVWEEERNPTQEMNAIMKRGRRSERHVSPEVSALIRTLIKGDNIKRFLPFSHFFPSSKSVG